jgi:hypothetical protein
MRATGEMASKRRGGAGVGRALRLTDLPLDALEHAVKFVALREVPTVAALSKSFAQAAAGDELWKALAGSARPQLVAMRAALSAAAGVPLPLTWRALVKQQRFARGTKKEKKKDRNTAASNFLLTAQVGEHALSVPLDRVGFAVWQDRDITGTDSGSAPFNRPAIVLPVPAAMHAAIMAGASGGSETIALEVIVCQRDTGGIAIVTGNRAGRLTPKPAYDGGHGANAMREWYAAPGWGQLYTKQGALFEQAGGGAFWNMRTEFDVPYNELAKHDEFDITGDGEFDATKHEGHTFVRAGEHLRHINAVLLPPSSADGIVAKITPDISQPHVSRQGTLGSLAAASGGAVLALVIDAVLYTEYTSSDCEWVRGLSDHTHEPASADEPGYSSARDRMFEFIQTWLLSLTMTDFNGQQEDFDSVRQLSHGSRHEGWINLSVLVADEADY